MKEKFLSAEICRNYSATEMIVENGKIIQADNSLPKCDEETDLGNKSVLPPYVDSHLHLDYVYMLAEMEDIDVAPGTLYEVIESWPKYRATMIIGGVKKPARKGIEDEVSRDVQFIRAQVDVTDPKFIDFRTLIGLEEEMENIMDIQVAAFPQNGMYTYKGGKELVEEVLKMGADVVGGAPHYEPAGKFGEKLIRDIVESAMKYNILVNVHYDETDDTMVRFVKIPNALVYLEDYGTETTTSHTCSLGSAGNSYAYKMFGTLKRSKMNLISCPTGNTYLQDRQNAYLKHHDLTYIKEFVHMDINVALAQDSTNNPWCPLGNDNMVNILNDTIHLSYCASPEEVGNTFDMITYNGTKCIDIRDTYGLEEGEDADFIVLDGNNSWDCIRRCVGILTSVREGESLFKRRPTGYEIPFEM